MKKLMVLLLVVFAVSLSSCAKFNTWAGANEPNLQLATHLGANLATRNSPERAAKITKWVEAVRAGIASGSFTTAGQVKTYILSMLSAENLTEADRIILVDLFNKVQESMVKEFEKYGIVDPAKQLVEIDKICLWILEITRTVK